MRNCFVISPIGEEGSEIRKRADLVYKHIISPVCKSCDFEPTRVDQVNASDIITQTIIDQLSDSDLVIADISGHNPNAFYEIGYRAATGRPIIHIKSKGETIPFDIAGQRAFEYDLADLDSVDEIKTRLIATINAFTFSEAEKQEESTKMDNQAITGQVMTALYDIQDNIRALREEIQDKDKSTIETIIKASQPPAVIEDPNTTMLKALLPEILKNPDAFKTLVELGKSMD